MRWLLPLFAVSLASARAVEQLSLGNVDIPVNQLVAGLPTWIAERVRASAASLAFEELLQLQHHAQSLPEDKLVQFESGGPAVRIKEGDKASLTLAGLRYVDVTDDRQAMFTKVEAKFPKKLRHSAKKLRPAFDKISIDDMREFLRRFTGFWTRYYRSPQGRESQLFLLEHLDKLHKDLNPKANISSTEFEHTWGQNSVIVRWTPENATESDEIIVLSAHQDSTNSLPWLRAPGADDDGSGTATLIATLSALLQTGYAPQTNPIEFHFYSAEEGGMLGSGQVSRAYLDAGKRIKSVFHMDVVAFVKTGTEPRIGVISDNVNQPLAEFMRLLISEYAEIPYVDTKCGYACSDHSSWHKLGQPAACLSEGRFEDSNTRMHSAQDTMDQPEYSFEHIVQFVRVALGYVAELAGMDERHKLL